MKSCNLNRFRRHRLSLALGMITATMVAAAPTSAAVFQLTYSGTLHAADSLAVTGGPDILTTDTPFTFAASFDTESGNVAGVLPNPGPGRGFVAYVPSQASFTIGGATYTLTDLGSATGPTIAIMDPSNVFFPGRFGVGLIVNPLADGAGFVGDFLSATPGFSVSALTSVVFQDFTGAGFSAGLGCGPDPAPCTFQPLGLRRGGQDYQLQFAGRAGATDGTVSYDGGSGTATLTAVPEPATWGMTILGFGAIGGAARRRRGGKLATRVI